jgi:hypothetical protein
LRRALPRLALGAVLGSVALWLAFRGIDAAELWRALQAVNTIWVGAALVSVALTTLVVTARWRPSCPHLIRKLLQLATYAGALADYCLDGRRKLPAWLSIHCFFFGGNVALLLGFFHSLMRSTNGAWARVGR